jgi:hypothetical protein
MNRHERMAYVRAWVQAGLRADLATTPGDRSIELVGEAFADEMRTRASLIILAADALSILDAELLDAEPSK